jgi:hypothetical protein
MAGRQAAGDECCGESGDGQDFRQRLHSIPLLLHLKKGSA